jgi:hypothetical protein
LAGIARFRGIREKPFTVERGLCRCDYGLFDGDVPDAGVQACGCPLYQVARRVHLIILSVSTGHSQRIASAPGTAGVR